MFRASDVKDLQIEAPAATQPPADPAIITVRRPSLSPCPRIDLLHLSADRSSPGSRSSTFALPTLRANSRSWLAPASRATAPATRTAAVPTPAVPATAIRPVSAVQSSKSLRSSPSLPSVRLPSSIRPSWWTVWRIRSPADGLSRTAAVSAGLRTAAGNALARSRSSEPDVAPPRSSVYTRSADRSRRRPLSSDECRRSSTTVSSASESGEPSEAAGRSRAAESHSSRREAERSRRTRESAPSTARETEILRQSRSSPPHRAARYSHSRRPVRYSRLRRSKCSETRRRGCTAISQGYESAISSIERIARRVDWRSERWTRSERRRWSRSRRICFRTRECEYEQQRSSTAAAWTTRWRTSIAAVRFCSRVDYAPAPRFRFRLPTIECEIQQGRRAS